MITCTTGKDNRNYYFKNGRRVSKSSIPRVSQIPCHKRAPSPKRASPVRAPSKRVPSPKITCTTGTNGQRYYYLNGIRISRNKVSNPSKLKCPTKQERARARAHKRTPSPKRPSPKRAPSPKHALSLVPSRVNRALNKYLPPDFLAGKTQISGPISLRTIYLKDNDMLIHIFGDRHFSRKHMCKDLKKSVKIEDLFQYLCDYNVSKYTLDIFLERRYAYKGQKSVNLYNVNEGPIFDAINRFFDCGYYENKKYCKYGPNQARIHFVDARVFEMLDVDKIFQKQGYKNMTHEQMYDYAVNFMRTHPALLKELKKVPQKLEIAIKIYILALIKLNYITCVQSDTPRNEAIILMMAPLFDMYSLCRLFKTYKIKAGENHSNQKCKQVMIYAGNIHAQNIANFLYKYFNPVRLEYLVKQIDEQPDRCIELNMPVYEYFKTGGGLL